jgi:hypothetical protein
MRPYAGADVGRADERAEHADGKAEETEENGRLQREGRAHGRE